jgi:purine nucleosidase
MGARPIIIDCDPGKDDAVALLLAFASPAELDVLAVTTVAGNVPLPLTAENARRICELAGRADTPVYAGCPRPILQVPTTAEHVHGLTGLDGADLPAAKMPLRRRHAVDFLVDRLLASDDGITLATLGPLTNLALAMIKEPRVVHKIHEIVLMGGTLGVGNVTPLAEFNIFADPHAAAVVFSAGAPLTMIGLDVTRQVIATADRVAAIRDIGRPAARAVAGMLEIHLYDAQDGGDTAGAALHDPCVIAFLLQPALFGLQELRIAVETTDTPALGRTTAVEDGDGADAFPVNVAMEVDAGGVFDLLIDRLARL